MKVYWKWVERRAREGTMKQMTSEQKPGGEEQRYRMGTAQSLGSHLGRV